MWTALVSLIGYGCAAGMTTILGLYMSGNAGWTFYTSRPQPPPPINLILICSLIQRSLLPVAALSSAMYLYLTERVVRQICVTRGFDVGPAEEHDDVQPAASKFDRLH